MKQKTIKAWVLGAVIGLAITMAYVGHKVSAINAEAKRNYFNLLRYSPQLDYQIHTSTNSDQVITSRLNRGEFTWPTLPPQTQTVFLAVELAADPFSVNNEPSLHVRWQSSREPVVQYIEQESQGLRYINVTALLAEGVAPGDQITLEGNHVDILNDQVSLHPFDEKPPATGNMLVLAPHPDDAEIAASGLYQARPPEATWVVTITAGENGGSILKHLFEGKHKQYEMKGRVRVYDSLTVPLLTGIPYGQVVNLGYFDGTLATLHQSPEQIVPSFHTKATHTSRFRRGLGLEQRLPDNPASTWNNLVTDLAALLETVQPSLVVTPHPLMDTHSDHQYTTVAMMEALARSQLDLRPTLLTYTNHIGTKLYPFGPADGVSSIPHLVDAEPANYWYDGVFSYHLPDDARALKLLALDLMHDIRDLPDFNDESLAKRAKRLWPELRQQWTSHRVDYLRRGPRPNELFYVIQPESLDTFHTQLITTLSNNREAN